MRSKRRPLKDSLLCVILDRETLGKSRLLEAAGKALRGGADMLQLRSKGFSAKETLGLALKLKKLAGRYRVPLIINDRVDIAAAAGSDGVHLGRSDLKVAAARRILGGGKLIGRTASRAAEVRRAKREGADYVGTGPVFGTPIKASRKPVGVGRVKKMCGLGIPVIAIGGINTRNIVELVRSGIKRVAVIRAVCPVRNTLRSTGRLKEAILR